MKRNLRVPLALAGMMVAATAAIPIFRSLPTGADRAEQRLAMVRETGDKEAICAASRNVADAWLSQRDRRNYAVAKSKADLACLDLAYRRYEQEHQ